MVIMLLRQDEEQDRRRWRYNRIQLNEYPSRSVLRPSQVDTETWPGRHEPRRLSARDSERRTNPWECTAVSRSTGFRWIVLFSQWLEGLCRSKDLRYTCS